MHTHVLCDPKLMVVLTGNSTPHRFPAPAEPMSLHQRKPSSSSPLAGLQTL